MNTRTQLLAAAALLALVLPCHAQQTQPRFESTLPRVTATTSQAAATSGVSAFLIEATGGIAGSLAGLGLIYSTESGCDVEDLVCNLRHAGTGIALATVGAGAGVYVAGRLGKTQPSILGAALGAIVGAAAGLGTVHLVSEELNWTNSDTAAIVTFGITQGIAAALGSRIVRALKD